MTYAEGTIRRKARNAGYEVQKGFIHQLTSDYPIADRIVGYNILDVMTGCLIPDCYNNVYDHLLSLEEVEAFLRSVYSENGLDW